MNCETCISLNYHAFFLPETARLYPPKCTRRVQGKVIVRLPEAHQALGMSYLRGQKLATFVIAPRDTRTMRASHLTAASNDA